MRKVFETTIVLLLLMFSISSKAQCANCSPVPACSGGNGSLVNNTVINTGQTYWYSGNGDTFNLTLLGGTLIVCGNLQLSSISFNGGTIFIAPGGSLTINSSLNILSNCAVYNYGTFQVNNPVIVYGSFSNCSTSSTFTVVGQLYIELGASLLNLGEVNTSHLVIDGGDICLENNSSIITGNITGSFSNTVSVLSGQACLSYSGVAYLYANVTTYSNLLVCQQPGASISGSSTFGNATLLINCTSCSYALPIELLSFKAKLEDQNLVKLYWVTASEINNDYFAIERSQDGLNFEQIGTVQGAGNSSTILNYVFYDEHPYEGTSYYRLKQADFNGNYTYSNIEVVYLKPFALLNIYPNPAENYVNILIGSPENIEVDITIFNSLGQKVISYQTELTVGTQIIKLNTQTLNAGNYVFKVVTPKGIHIEKEFIKH